MVNFAKIDYIHVSKNLSIQTDLNDINLVFLIEGCWFDKMGIQLDSTLIQDAQWLGNNLGEMYNKHSSLNYLTPSFDFQIVFLMEGRRGRMLDWLGKTILCRQMLYDHQSW